MPSPSPHSPNVYDSATDPDSSPAVPWIASIKAAPESALLSRILQRAGPPEAEILHVRYDAGLSTPDVTPPTALVEILFKAQPARARSIASKWEKIVPVQRVSLFPLPPGGHGLGSLPIPGVFDEPAKPVPALD